MALLAHRVTKTFGSESFGAQASENRAFVLGFFVPVLFACLVSVLMVFALMQECEGHTDAAYITSRRMAPHLCIPHTLCFGGLYAWRSS